MTTSLSLCLSVCLSLCLFVFVSLFLSLFFVSVCLSIHLSVSLPSFCLSFYPSFCLSTHLPVFLSICLSLYPSVCLSIHLPVSLPIFWSVFPTCFYITTHSSCTATAATALSDTQKKIKSISRRGGYSAEAITFVNDANIRKPSSFYLRFLYILFCLFYAFYCYYTNHESIRIEIPTGAQMSFFQFVCDKLMNAVEPLFSFCSESSMNSELVVSLTYTSLLNLMTRTLERLTR